jgi:hypothetical protein
MHWPSKASHCGGRFVTVNIVLVVGHLCFTVLQLVPEKCVKRRRLTPHVDVAIFNNAITVGLSAPAPPVLPLFSSYSCEWPAHFHFLPEAAPLSLRLLQLRIFALAFPFEDVGDINELAEDLASCPVI